MSDATLAKIQKDVSLCVDRMLLLLIPLVYIFDNCLVVVC
jgi:hypothetical protein